MRAENVQKVGVGRIEKLGIGMAAFSLPVVDANEQADDVWRKAGKIPRRRIAQHRFAAKSVFVESGDVPTGSDSHIILDETAPAVGVDLKIGSELLGGQRSVAAGGVRCRKGRSCNGIARHIAKAYGI